MVAIERVSKRWLVAGTLATVGGYWLAVRLLRDAGVDPAALPYLAHGVGAAAAGAVTVRHAPLRPWREPLFAGLLGAAVVALLFLALPHPMFAWVAARAAHPWPTACGIALLSGVSACGGAACVRRVAPSASSGTASLLVLSGLVTLGAAVVIAQTPIGLGLAPGLGYSTAVFTGIGVFAGGYLTQSLVTIRRPWVCGGGMFLFLLPLATRNLDNPEHAVDAALGVMLFAVIGAWGARLAWRRKERNGETVELALPAARLEL